MYKDGIKYRPHLERLRRLQFEPLETIHNYQLKQIIKLLHFAYENSPFYRKRFQDISLNPHNIKSFNDFLRIPFLTKKDLQDNLQEIKSRNIPEKYLILNKTGGSTGKPVHFYYDKECLNIKRAATILHDSWANYLPGDKLALIWGSRRDISWLKGIKASIRNMFLERKLILDSSSLTEKSMLDFAEKLKKFKPKTILAYTHSLYLFAKFCKKYKILDIQPQSIITSAELLHPEERNLIGEVFQCPIFNRYGSREFGVIASECEYHKGLHLNAGSLYVEILKNNKPVSLGEEGEIVITDLWNYGTPFIRYKIEDVGMFLPEKCPCGRNLPLIKITGGRVSDFLVTPEGKMISGSALTIYLIANIPGIRQAQFIQKIENEIILKLVINKEFESKGKKILEKEIEKFLGKEIKVKYKFVDDIPREPSGKYRFSISDIVFKNF